jgi:aspartate-semialdehyde dehydrogenase
MRTAILGASGLVGRAMLTLLEREPWADQPPVLLTSSRSAGARLPFRGQDLVCKPVVDDVFAAVDVALFSAGGETSRRWAPVAAAAGAWVIDNSSAWRQDPRVALVVPEINGDLVPALAAAGPRGGIIANPNCSTIQIAMALAPLAAAFGLREAHITTLQAASGAGQKGRDELAAHAAALASGERADGGVPGAVFSRRLAANVIPAIGDLDDEGHFSEERKVHDELRKILARPDLAVSCTVTRVPVWNGHSAAVRAVLAREVDLDEARASLASLPGVEVGATAADYLTPAEISGRTIVHVGRLRHESGRRDVLLLWVVADNLLKGAAWNAVQIARRLAGVDR